ncbi:MAG: CcmD family protein [Candidatus Hydrothermia bacterium]
MIYLFLAYLVFWVFIFFYIFILYKKLKNFE